jgi:hypothetical protein
MKLPQRLSNGRANEAWSEWLGFFGMGWQQRGAMLKF